MSDWRRGVEHFSLLNDQTARDIIAAVLTVAWYSTKFAHDPPVRFTEDRDPDELTAIVLDEIQSLNETQWSAREVEMLKHLYQRVKGGQDPKSD